MIRFSDLGDTDATGECAVQNLGGPTVQIRLTASRYLHRPGAPALNVSVPTANAVLEMFGGGLPETCQQTVSLTGASSCRNKTAAPGNFEERVQLVARGWK